MSKPIGNNHYTPPVNPKNSNSFLASISSLLKRILSAVSGFFSFAKKSHSSAHQEVIASAQQDETQKASKVAQTPPSSPRLSSPTQKERWQSSTDKRRSPTPEQQELSSKIDHLNFDREKALDLKNRVSIGTPDALNSVRETINRHIKNITEQKVSQISKEQIVDKIKKLSDAIRLDANGSVIQSKSKELQESAGYLIAALEREIKKSDDVTLLAAWDASLSDLLKTIKSADRDFDQLKKPIIEVIAPLQNRIEEIKKEIEKNILIDEHYTLLSYLNELDRVYARLKIKDKAVHEIQDDDVHEIQITLAKAITDPKELKKSIKQIHVLATSLENRLSQTKEPDPADLKMLKNIIDKTKSWYASLR